MKILNKLKEKIIERLAEVLLGSLTLITTGDTFLFDHLGLGKLAQSIGSVLLGKSILFLSAASIGLVAYIISKRPKYKFIHSGNLFWIKNDPLLFCERCYQIDNKVIHMKIQNINPSKPHDPESYLYVCVQCKCEVSLSEHPCKQNA